jgi:hypothetical protein
MEMDVLIFSDAADVIIIIDVSVEEMSCIIE